jgi:type III pantothenate kinase
MILAVDIGNSNIVIGGMEDQRILFEARLRTDATKTSDEYCIDLKMILEVYEVSPKSIEGAIISSVVPQVLNSIKTAIMKVIHKEPLVVGPGMKTGLNIKTDIPSQVGSDRIVVAVAALAEYEPPLALLDLGTATTIDVVDGDSNYIGGCILPGVRISLEALTSRTAQLPGINLDTPGKVIGKNTVDCMRSGIMYGTAAQVDGLLDRMEEELGAIKTVVATGGMAQFIVPLCRREIELDKDLLLKGLNILYKKNAHEKRRCESN